MISGKSRRRLVFVEAENIAGDFMLLSGKVPPFIQETGLEGVVAPQQIVEKIQAFRYLGVDDYIRQTVLPSEYPKRKNAPEVIRALGGEIIHEEQDGPLYLAEINFTWGERSRRVLVLAQNRKSRNGVWMPKHHRKATQLLRFYAPYSLPVITFIDTPGADAGEEANRNNQAHAISELIAEMANLSVPTVGIVFGNGYSGGAIPLAATNVLLSVRDGVFNTIHPTGLSEIAYNYNLSWQECAKYIGVSAYELCQAGYLDGIIDYSPVDADPPRAVVGAVFSALDRIEANAVTFLRDTENAYFFQYYRESILRYLHPRQGNGHAKPSTLAVPAQNLTVFGAFYRFHRYLKMRRRLSSQSVLRYSRVDIQHLPTGELQDRMERERIGRFNKWLESPLEVRYDDQLSKRYRRYLDTFNVRGEERTRFASFFMGRPEDNFKRATQELALELGLHLYNYWKVEAKENLAQLLQFLEGAGETQPKELATATLLDVLKLPPVREEFFRHIRNLILFDLLYDRLVENLPLIARELKDTNVITEQSMADLLNKVFKEASGTFNTIFPTIGTKEGNEDFFYWLESLISRLDVEKLMRQVSEWKRLAFPRLSEPLFGVLTYYFSNLLPSFYSALRGERRFDGKINPRQIGIKDFWNRLNQAYRDLLIQNLLTEYKLSNAITPQHILQAFFSRFDEINSDLMTSDPVRFPGFRQSIERALEQNIPPVGVLTGFADFKYSDVSSRVGLVVSNTRFQAGAFDMASGEKVCKLMAECAVNRLPVIMFISSGGMQTKEGAGALFSMSVLNDRITQFVQDFGLPVICFGFRDCTGGAQASFVTHPLARTYYFSGAMIPFAGQRVVPSHLPAESILANYLSQTEGSMDGLVVNPFDEELDAKLREIDPTIPVPAETVPEVIARILKGELRREAEAPAEEALPAGYISFTPVKRMLIHARGCTAARLIQGAQAAGVEIVLVQSDADMESYPTKLLRATDRLVSLGGNTPQESYLNGMSVIRIAEMENVDAIHPGIGFLSENPDFALLCRKHGYNFIGPRAHSMEMMGNKSNAIATARRLNVPTVPGSHGVLTDAGYALAVAQELGFPVLIKATYGGGGKGMRVVHDPARFKEDFARTSQEALAAFGNGDVYLEKFVESMRHVEAQVLRDSRGNTRILGLRDCSVQRDNQKLIEESGSTELPEDLRQAVFAHAEAIANGIDYIGAGTIEFIFDRKNQRVYFMEMNTRLQVEHPVTEMVTGVDIVEEQIRIASGKTIEQIEVKSKGYAMEVRINAEKMAVSPEGKVSFTPSPGVVAKLNLPPSPDIRVISAIQEGSTIPPYYDSLIVQIIAHAEDRSSVVAKLRGYLERVQIEGVYTNLALMEAILADPVFQAGAYDTRFLQGFYERTELNKVLERMEARNQSTARAIDLDAIRIENSDELKVLSPRTGVFYASPTPDDAPFVEVGSVFDIHSPICLMEAMKVFEQLTLADYNKHNGARLFPEDSRFTVTRVLAESGQTVNQGDLLFIVKPVPLDTPLTVPARAN
jgi:acetyl/propionyl-CoA carboxylase alpha subunit/acetyl-CoA carboxylase beta subunit